MRPVSVKWLPANTTAISAAQLVDAGDNFIFNGTMAGNVPPNPGVSFLALGQSRTVSLRAPTVDNSGVNFTITGTYLGVVVSQTIAGPGVGLTVYTTQLFDTVTSIVPSIDTPGTVSVGSGTTGRFSWILYNNHATFPSLSVEAEVSGSAGSITYRFISTLDEIAADKPLPGVTVGIVVPDGSGVTAFKTVMDGTAPTNPVSTIMANTNFLYRYYTIEVTAQAAGFNGALLATFIQGGTN